LFEAITLVQTQKTYKFPIVLMGSEFWNDLVDWIKNTLVKQKMILPNDIDIFYITDDPVKAAKIIAEFYKKHHIVTNF
jgi:predicted Rossmann-fold nucleotide-binding protein